MQADAAHKNYYPWFDWLRVALALVVLLGHDGLLHGWQYSANFAVQVFFALSGWLIGGILLNTPKKDLPRFYFNRALRIWVPYFIALFLLVLASLLHDPLTLKWLEFIIYKLSFVYNIFGPPQLEQFVLAMPLQGTGNHFWSVNAEEQFYLLAPLLLILAPAHLGKNIFIWLALAILSWLTHTYASIVFGVLAAIIVKQYGSLHVGITARLIFFTVIVLASIAFIKQVEYMLIAPFCAIAIVMLLATTGKQTAIGAFVGGISYPLYMNQWIGGFVANAFIKYFGLNSPTFKHALTILLSLTIAAVLYWYIERRMLAARTRLYNEARGRMITIVAYASVIFGIAFGLVLKAT